MIQNAIICIRTYIPITGMFILSCIAGYILFKLILKYKLYRKRRRILETMNSDRYFFIK